MDFSSLSRSPYADDISQKCSIRFVEDQILVNDEYAISRDTIVHHWWSEVDGVNHQLLTYLFVRHLENDELIASVLRPTIRLGRQFFGINSIYGF